MFSFISLSFDILSLVMLNGMACFPCIKHSKSFTGSSVTVFKGEQAKCNLSAEFHFFPRCFHFFPLSNSATVFKILCFLFLLQQITTDLEA